MKIFFDTVGCRLNQAEIEHMAGQFRAAGHVILESAEGADLVIVNTCSVTAAAASDSRQKARRAHQFGAQRIILTGCWATLEPEKAIQLSGVSEVVNNLQKMNIPLRVMGLEQEDFDLEPIERRPLPGVHLRTRAFIKVQDGCDNHCTFCVTRIARGKSRSIAKEVVLQQIKLAEKGGVREVVLSGVHLGAWGREIDQAGTISDLIKYLLQNSTIERIRLSSVEPWNLNDDFFSLWQNPRMCRHLHLPLQSGSTRILKRMARNTTPELFAELVAQARKWIPDVAITTDVIVGFPGESEEDFEDSLNFVKKMNFSGGHVFKFSPRDGTAAEKLDGRIAGPVAQQRSAMMKAVILTTERSYLQAFEKSELQVLWDASSHQLPDGSWWLHGMSDNYIKVEAKATENRWNTIDRVQDLRIERNVLVGTIVI